MTRSTNLSTPSKAAKIVVIGGGPAGLTAAYQLSKAGLYTVVLEKDSDVGGISRTVQYKGYGFDIGGHRFYTKVHAVENLWHELLTADEFRVCGRLSRIYYNRKFFRYPIQALDAMKNLGLVNSILIVLSYMRAKILPHRHVHTFEQNITNRFGRRLFNTFFKSYTEKVWGIPCSEISSDWANQRIKGLGLGTAVKQAILQTLGLKPKSKEKAIKTLIDQFHYPTFGPGMMWRRAAERIQERGGEVRLETDVTRIVWDGERTVHNIEISNGAGIQTLDGSHFISSMPIRELIQKMEPAPPMKVQAAANRLHYRDFLTVALIINQPDIFPDNWIYIHEPDVKLGRVQNFKNWSQEMVADSSKTCLGLEYFCFEGDGLWSMSDEELIELGKREIEALGLAKAADVEDGSVVRQPKAYPVYDADYQKSLETLREFLSSFKNLQVVGRNGMHRYNNQDHSMLTAMLAAENILGANYDLWKVNAEQEYHEEVTPEEEILDEELLKESKVAILEHSEEQADAGDKVLTIDEALMREDIARLNSTQPHVPEAVAKNPS